MEQYAREGAVAPLVVIARDGTQKERWNALFRLYTLARAGDYASELVDEGVITLFTSLLPSAEVIPCEELPVLRHAARHLREDAASVLGYLAGANENDTNAAAVARAGAIPVLMSIMADGFGTKAAWDGVGGAASVRHMWVGGGRVKGAC